MALAQGQAVVALAALRTAFGLWQQLDAPYETGRTRVLLADAYRALGDQDAANREFTAARACFERLGAAADLRALVPAATPEAPCGLTAREVEVIGLVATGRSNRDIAGELFISDKTVARHVANIFLNLDVTTRSAATAWVYENGLLQRSMQATPGENA
ncbi:MAG: helix-turn-helix domain-containing protein [Acidimicrobiales bacterium]